MSERGAAGISLVGSFIEIESLLYESPIGAQVPAGDGTLHGGDKAGLNSVVHKVWGRRLAIVGCCHHP